MHREISGFALAAFGILAVAGCSGGGGGGSPTQTPTPTPTATSTLPPSPTPTPNHAPSAINDQYDATEDTPLVVAAGSGVLSNDTDADGDTLTATPIATPAHGSVALAADGSFTYTPAANYDGDDSFTYQANDGTADSGVATVAISVAAVDDAPVAANDAYTTAEDTALDVAAPGVLANDTDVDSATLTATLVAGPTHGSLTLSADGTVHYVPDANFNGADSFTYHANDGTLASADATVTISVTAVNDAPVAADDAYATDEDTTLVVTAPGVLANDTDADGDPLLAMLATAPTHGTLALSTSGAFSYLPDPDFNGSDSFGYRAFDGTATSGIATVAITVNPVEDAPVANGDAVSTAEDTPLSIDAPGVLANDTDADGDALTASVDVAPAHGALALASNGSFSYTPEPDFNGADSFTYHAFDGTLPSASATVSITVTPVNDAPVAAGDAYSTDEGSALAVAAPGVLANDSDVDGDPLTAVLTTAPTHGTFSLAADGSFTYTPTTGYFGSDSFAYEAKDGSGALSAAATVALTVTRVDQAPVAVTDSYSATEDTKLTVAAPGVLANDTDADGDALRALLVSAPSAAEGTVTLTTDGALTFTPKGGFHDTATFSYQVTDGTLTSNTVNVTIAVAPGAQIAKAVASFASTGNDYPTKVIPVGNGYAISGYFQGSMTFGAGQPSQTTLTTGSGEYQDFFIAMYTSADTLVWAKRIVPADTGVTLGGIAALSDGSIVADGYVGNGITFGPGEPGQQTVSFGSISWLARFAAADGTFLWSRESSAGYQDHNEGTAICVIGGLDMIVEVGTIKGGPATFSGGSVTRTIDPVTNTETDAYWAEWRADGSLYDAQETGGGESSSTQISPTIVVPVPGTYDFVIAGSYTPAYAFGTHYFGSGGYGGAFVARFGSTTWANSIYGTQSSDYGRISAISALSDGSLIATGTMSGRPKFGIFGGTQAGVGNSGNAWFGHLSQYTGSFTGIETVGGGTATNGGGIGVFADDSIVIGGNFRGSTTFGYGTTAETTVTSVAATQDGFLAGYHANDSLAWARDAIGGGGSDAIVDVTVIPSGVVAVGYISDTATAGAGDPGAVVLAHTGSLDLCVLRY